MSDLNEIGIKSVSRAIRVDELMKKQLGGGDFGAILTQNVGAYTDPEVLQELWGSALERTAWCGTFRHPDVTKLLDEAAKESDPQTRKELFYQADELIVSLQPGTFLFHKTVLNVMSKRIVMPLPFSLDFSGYCRLRHASIRSK
jgi:ABC-type transport system substrate-binding protein